MTTAPTHDQFGFPHPLQFMADVLTGARELREARRQERKPAKRVKDQRGRVRLTPDLLRRLNTALAAQKSEARAKVQAEKRQEREERRSRARFGETMDQHDHIRADL
jgi:hypothetical protein